MAPKTLVVPALAGGGPWRPTGVAQTRTVANWAHKHMRLTHTDAEGLCIGHIELFDDEYVFSSWVPFEDRRFGAFTGPPVVFAWRDYWGVISAGGKPMAGHSFSRAPDLCTSVDTGLPSPYPHVPGNLWALMFAWYEDAGGPALAGEPASGREFRLQLQQSADGKPPTAMTMNREAIDGDAYRQLRHVKGVASKIKASWPGASLRESAGKPRQPSPGSTNRRGLVGGAELTPGGEVALLDEAMLALSGPAVDAGAGQTPPPWDDSNMAPDVVKHKEWGRWGEAFDTRGGDGPVVAGDAPALAGSGVTAPVPKPDASVPSKASGAASSDNPPPSTSHRGPGSLADTPKNRPLPPKSMADRHGLCPQCGSPESFGCGSWTSWNGGRYFVFEDDAGAKNYMNADCKTYWYPDWIKLQCPQNFEE